MVDAFGRDSNVYSFQCSLSFCLEDTSISFVELLE
uniref:Uncharacterized protein n=1 Tax=Lepeophtheirus salmonis TaxID=72036 RepID=A0A0K2UEK9_LEPSM